MGASDNYETIVVQTDDGVSTITLNRPDSLNAFNEAMKAELLDTLKKAERDDAIRCLVITGEGRAFSSGQDLADLKDVYAGTDPPDLGQMLRDAYNPLIKKMRGMDKPIIAAVNGVAAGGGLAMVLGSDVAIASDRARFRVAHRDLGMAAMDALGWLLPRAVGKQRAFEMYATNRIVEAEEAERVGLVLKVVPHAELMTETMELARTLADGPPIGLKMTKRGILRGSTHSLEEYLEFERLAYQNCYFSEDSKEARKAFLEKRPPKFQGR